MPSRFSSRLPWPSPENALTRERDARRARGLPLLNLVESNPTRCGLSPFDGLDPGTRNGLAALAGPASLRYDPDPRGCLEARESLAAFCRGPAAGLSGPAIDPARLFLSASTSEAYGWLFKLLADPGDVVLVPKPGYPLFDFLAGLEGVEPRSYRLSYVHPRGWSIDLDSLEEGLKDGRAKAVVLINPNNPTGSHVDGRERRAVVELARRHGAALIVDEVFLGFPVEGARRPSFLGEEGVLTFVLDGLSKALCLPQMKLGWIALSGPRAEAEEAAGRLEIVADTYLSAGTPVMRALPSWLGLVPAFQERVGARLGANLATLRGLLEGEGSPHRVLRCEGGWTALVEAPRLAGEEGLALGLLREEGLIVHPGYYFDMEREAYFATSLILPEAEFAEGVARYLDYFRRLLA